MAALNSLRYRLVDHNESGSVSIMDTVIGQACMVLCIYLMVGMGSVSASMSGFLPPENDHNCLNEVSPPSLVVDPDITVRFSNPQFSCTNAEYCMDVEFKSSIANKELFGMNVRFFYDDPILEIVDFRGFQGGYGPVAPNPPSNTYSSSAGPSLFNFSGGADYINGAVQKTNANAPPIYISTTGWTKLFQICFVVDDQNANENNFCPSLVWDLEVNPANGGFLPGSAGVVMTVVEGSGSANALEHVNQFNWEYIGNGNAPYGQPVNQTCSSIACPTCNLIVNSTLDSGTGTLRDALACASNGDTIKFASNMAGATITISSARLVLNKNVYIRNTLTPKVKITSSLAGLFEVTANKTVEFKDIEITSGLTMTNNDGAAFKNEGTLKLINVSVFKNPSLPTGQYLIRNKPGSQFNLSGSCFIEIP